MTFTKSDEAQENKHALLGNVEAPTSGMQSGTQQTQDLESFTFTATGPQLNTQPAQGQGGVTSSTGMQQTQVQSSFTASHTGMQSGTHQMKSAAQSPEAGQQNTKTVVGVFDSRQQAETSVHQLRQQGFTHDEVSIVAKKHEGDDNHSRTHGAEYNDTIVDGVATGGTIGGIGGLMAAAGALAIPGFGPIIALGPIAAAISGAVAGGVAGGLIDFGIPAEHGKAYEAEIHRGRVLAIVRAESAKVSQAADILRQNGAKDVETH